jgi:cytochrome c biogenesis protein CcmG, thiol:disulfide interchange protein DsbE
VISGDGTITHQHVGDIRAEHVPMLLEKLREAE